MSPTFPSTRPIALTIAGSDSGGGAGIQADLKIFTQLGCFGTSALTAVTAQNTRGVRAASLLDPGLVLKQIDAVAADLPPAATKTGMLGSAEMVETVARAIRKHRLFPLVVDPVMIAKSGDPLIDAAAVDAILHQLLPLATLITPNRHEAGRLVGFEVKTIEQAKAAAQCLCDRSRAQACVVKTIRQPRDGREMSVDVFYSAMDKQHRLLPHRWHAAGQPNTHGSGCTFSAAITAELARGNRLEPALETAIAHIDRALASPIRLGRGISPVDHLAVAGATAATTPDDRA